MPIWIMSPIPFHTDNRLACFFSKNEGQKVEKNSTAELFIIIIILILRLAIFGEASNLVA